MKGKSFTLLAVIIILIGMLSTSAINGLNLGGLNINSVSDSMKLGLDIEGGVAVVFEAVSDQTGDELEKTISQTISVLTRRINVLGLTEPNISKQGTNRIRVELPGVANAEDAIDMIGTTAQLNFMLVEKGSIAKQGMTIDDFKGQVVLNGEDVKGAELGADQYNKPAVVLKFNSSGVDKFTSATRTAAQYRGQIAIVLDGEVISAPSVSEQITKDSAIITGNFTSEEADGLAKLIRGGALPVNLKEVQTTVIGPTLGRDALDSSVNAAKIGLILVCIFMIVYYRVPGLASVISLMLYASLVSYIMVLMNATLTLPGIAGIVLGIGMAVDANVIIFERIKEEIRNGKTIRAAIVSGFSRAFRTIIDSNITTFIAAIVLFYFGEGPIKGFAVTLMIGIVSSMFTAVVLTKSILKIFNNLGFLQSKKLFGA